MAQNDPSVIGTHKVKINKCQPIELPDILKFILEFQSIHNLKECRLVSSKWRQIVTHILLQRKDVHVTISEEEEEDKQVEIQNQKNWRVIGWKAKTMKAHGRPMRQVELEKFVENTKKTQWPCAHLTIALKVLSLKSCQKFVQVHGHNLKNLNIVSNYQNEVNGVTQAEQAKAQISLETFWMILIHAPNIKELSIPQLSSTWCTVWSDKNEILKLAPKLERTKTLEITYKTSWWDQDGVLVVPEIFIHIFNKYSPLIILDFYDWRCCSNENIVLRSLQSTSHVSTWSYFDQFREHRDVEKFEKMVEIFENYSKLDPILKGLRIDHSHFAVHLNVPGMPTQLGVILTAILESSKQTLTSLSLSHIQKFLPKFKLPAQLNKLHSLHVSYDSPPAPENQQEKHSHGLLGSRDLNWARMFPVLRTVDISLDFWNCDLDMEVNPTNSVEELTLSGCESRLSEKEFEYFSKTFCALKCLKINHSTCAFDLDKLVQIIWTHFPAICRLSCHTIKLNSATHQVDKMDAAITGHSPSLCRELRYKLNHVDLAPEFPSIRCMRNLTSMSLKFDSDATLTFIASSTAREQSVVSMVSKKYGFDLLPQLKVMVDLSHDLSTFYDSEEDSDEELNSLYDGEWAVSKMFDEVWSMDATSRPTSERSNDRKGRKEWKEGMMINEALYDLLYILVGTILIHHADLTSFWVMWCLVNFFSCFIHAFVSTIPRLADFVSEMTCQEKYSMDHVFDVDMALNSTTKFTFRTMGVICCLHCAVLYILFFTEHQLIIDNGDSFTDNNCSRH